MNTEQLLERIFRLARLARLAPPPAPAFGLETAVLAHWRAAAAERSPNGRVLRGLRWAALAACAIALLTAALKRDEVTAFNRRSDPVARLADSALVVGYGYE